MGIVVGAMALLAIPLVLVWLLRRRPSGTIAATGRGILDGVPRTPSTITLIERWRDRAARWRSVVALPVVLATIVASLAIRGSVDVGLGAQPAWSDPLLTGLLSVFVAAIAAELHHLRRRSEGPRVVDLVPRTVGGYLPEGSRRRLGLLGAYALFACTLAFAVAGTMVPWLGLLALSTVCTVPLVQRGIVGRGRPALDSDLRLADDAVRMLAVRSVDEAGAGAALLLSAWQLAPAAAAVSAPTAIEVGLALVQVASLVVAIAWWRRSNPRRLLPDVAAALQPHDRLGTRP